MDVMTDDSLQRVKQGKNLGFLFEEEDKFSAIGFKVSQAPDKSCFLKAAKLRYNGQLKLIYFVENYQNLTTMLASVQTGTISVLLYKLLYAISQLPEYGYISCENILISPDDIYFDSKTLEPKLVYIPVVADNSPEAQRQFETRLRRNLYNAIKSYGQIDIETLKGMLSDTSEGLQDLQKALQKMANISGTKVAAVSDARMILQSKLPQYNLRFEVTKDYFTLGRGKDRDVVLGFSNMISRKHCSILRKNNKYYLMDEGSTKGTFLNGKKCQPMVQTPLADGDTIGIWELSFVVKII